ncbi:hypothetical protein H206_05283 [Candidatus Electrothrix aarhusensis]|uniref:Uncharacterized protein n=1 Tax=Candidatus Electrothrix aarhusensis TaxID=1859131 RepID=A0A3S3UE88_9BACT|nr:hypothetical protein H206_05283 [Candidatus Electrothrix aarhusensis]
MVHGIRPTRLLTRTFVPALRWEPKKAASRQDSTTKDRSFKASIKGASFVSCERKQNSL